MLAAAQEFPQRLEWSRTRYSDIESITAAELSTLARQYLDPAHASEFIVLPEAKAASEPQKPAEPAAPTPPEPVSKTNTAP